MRLGDRKSAHDVLTLRLRRITALRSSSMRLVESSLSSVLSGASLQASLEGLCAALVGSPSWCLLQINSF
jgi:hypothetical protein